MLSLCCLRVVCSAHASCSVGSEAIQLFALAEAESKAAKALLMSWSAFCLIITYNLNDICLICEKSYNKSRTPPSVMCMLV